jgi:hypothetical protein
MRFYNFFVLSAAVFILAGISQDGYASRIWPKWQVTECEATIENSDGTHAAHTFEPKDAWVETCYKWGTRPDFCKDWRENIRNACKVAYAKTLSGKKNKNATISFEGCAERPKASGALALPDWFIRKLSKESIARYYKVCSTDPDSAIADLQAEVDPATMGGSKSSAIYNYFSSIAKSAGQGASNLWETAQKKAKAGKDLVKGSQAYNYTADTLDSLQKSIKKNLSGLSTSATQKILTGTGYGLAGREKLPGVPDVPGDNVLGVPSGNVTMPIYNPEMSNF